MSHGPSRDQFTSQHFVTRGGCQSSLSTGHEHLRHGSKLDIQDILYRENQTTDRTRGIHN